MATKTLQGLKILVTAYDLEQSEHRGIAVYSKSLLHCLHQAGAEVWLLTEFFDKLSENGLKRLPQKTQEMIHNARILNSLALGRRERPTTALQRKFKLARKAKNIGTYLRLLINILRRPRVYKLRDLNSFQLQDLYDNPYVRIERLDYLEHVTGIVSAPDIFLASQLASQLSNMRSVCIDLREFDALITTCPLNIKPHNISTFVQTIHDLIPLEYVAHNEDPLMFSHRLQACMSAHRLFVSESTANKFTDHIHNPHNPLSLHKNHNGHEPREKVIIQSPSLHFPSWLTQDPKRIADLQPVSHLLRKLTPFRYFLFNSLLNHARICYFSPKHMQKRPLQNQTMHRQV